MEPKTAPNISEGIESIEYWIKRLAGFQKEWSDDYKPVFKMVFKEDGKHLIGKLPIKDWGCFFLNLDNKNQVRLLKVLDHKRLNFSFPPIPDWQTIGSKIGLDDDFTEEDVRGLAAIWKDANEWDLYPHILVWFRKFCLYANNNSLPETYKGDRFGNYQNWADYFPYMEREAQKEFCTGLISYS